MDNPANEPSLCSQFSFWKKGKTPTPKTRFRIWTLLRTPGRFTTRPLLVQFTTEMSVVRPFLVLSKDEIVGAAKPAEVCW